MRNMIQLLAVAILSMACGSDNNQPIVSQSSNYTVYEPTSESNGKRLYLIHGTLRADRLVWEKPIYKSLVIKAQAQGFEVITFDRKHFYADLLQDGGLEYRAFFKNQMESIVAEVESNRGQLENIVGGVSMGGLHAMMAIADMPEKFTAFFAVHPVIELNALSELSQMTSEHFNPKNEVSVLETKKSYIARSDRDEVVNEQHIVDMIGMLNNQDLDTEVFNGVNHRTTYEIMSSVANWLETL